MVRSFLCLAASVAICLLSPTFARAQKLAAALKTCKKKYGKSKKKRAACEKQSRKKYGAKKSSKSKRVAGKSSSKVKR